MSTYFDKKKLIEENSDLYISPYDKNLNPDALGSVIEAKKAYNVAKEAGDVQGMKNANDRANAVRKENGRYVGGIDGSEYSPIPKNYEAPKTKSYESPYAKTMEALSDKLISKADFEYDPYKDPIFKTYYNLYTRLGDEAYDRALATSALRTGGMASSAAISAAMQAKNKYNTMIDEKIPELYTAAYKRYSDEYDRLYQNLDAVSELDEMQYRRYRDDAEDFARDREYYYNIDKDMAKLYDDIYRYETDMEYKLTSDAYTKERDAVDDARFREEMDYKKERAEADDKYRQDSLTLSENQKNTQFAINLAKILYGKVPVNPSTVQSLLAIIR